MTVQGWMTLALVACAAGFLVWRGWRMLQRIWGDQNPNRPDQPASTTAAACGGGCGTCPRAQRNGPFRDGCH